MNDFTNTMHRDTMDHPPSIDTHREKDAASFVTKSPVVDSVVTTPGCLSNTTNGAKDGNAILGSENFDTPVIDNTVLKSEASPSKKRDAHKKMTGASTMVMLLFGKHPWEDPKYYTAAAVALMCLAMTTGNKEKVYLLVFLALNLLQRAQIVMLAANETEWKTALAKSEQKRAKMTSFANDFFRAMEEALAETDESIKTG